MIKTYYDKPINEGSVETAIRIGMPVKCVVFEETIDNSCVTRVFLFPTIYNHSDVVKGVKGSNVDI